MSENKFITISTQEAISYLKRKNKDLADIDYQLKGNNANVYLLADGTAVLVPNSWYKSFYPAFIFYKINFLTEMVEEDFFPIDDGYKTDLEKEASKIKNIEDNYYYYLTYLNSKTNLDIQELNEKNLKKAYQYLGNTKKSEKDDFTKLVLSYCVVLGNYIKIKEGGQWYILKKYASYNPFYLPSVKVNGKIYRVFDKLVMALDGAKPASFEFMMNTIYKY